MVYVRIGVKAMASTACLPSTPTQAFRETRHWIPTKCERAYIAPYQANLCNSSCGFSLNYACTRQHVGSNWVSLERRGGLKTANWRTQLWGQVNRASSSQQGGALVTVNSLAGPRTVMMASALFTFATAFVLPFYTTMIVAPRWEWTKKLADSNFPYVVLGALYIYLLSLSWNSETLQLMFASKYWLPELPGITHMFSSTMTVASAWIHLLAADLYCGRHVYLDGLRYNVETRHSLILCLMVCPIGIFCHMVTKQFTLYVRRAPGGDGTEVATVLV